MLFVGSWARCLLWTLGKWGICRRCFILGAQQGWHHSLRSANNITWLADANLAVNIHFGLPTCTGTGAVTTCINPSGSMNYPSPPPGWRP
ncbi:MAG TPA: hypothetical protein VKB88_34495 [Bryobacteraceae bacterium]|nr:hypothetical protein [Bryobacteraceae bacterium]